MQRLRKKNHLHGHVLQQMLRQTPERQKEKLSSNQKIIITLQENDFIVLIGGYPKGHDRPFHPATVSGRRLRKLVNTIGLNAKFLDLWISEDEERRGKIDNLVLAILNRYIKQRIRCFALGKWVHSRLAKQGINILYLPHPASRRKTDIETLEKRLRELAQE